METIWTITSYIVTGFELIGIGMLALFTATQAMNGNVPRVIRRLYDAIFVLYDEEDL